MFTDGRFISLLPTIKISEGKCLTTSLCFILSLSFSFQAGIVSAEVNSQELAGLHVFQ